MTGLAARPGLGDRGGRELAACCSSRKGDERREEWAEAEAEATQAARAFQTNKARLLQYYRVGAPPPPPTSLCADEILQAGGILGRE